MGKCKVMLLLKSNIYSGAESVAIKIIETLRDKYTFIYVSRKGPIQKILDKKCITYQLLQHFDYVDVNLAIGKFQPDIIHAHDFTASVLAATCAHGKAKIISQLHYDPPWVYKLNFKSLIFAMAAKNIDRLYLLNENKIDQYNFYMAFKDKIKIIGNPIDTDEIRRKAIENTEIAASDIIFVGRLVYQKNPEAFIHLMFELKEKGVKKIRAVMLGTGELEDKCKTLIKNLHLEANIKMVGFTDNPYCYIKNSKILCMTSRWEGYGLVCLEAATLGKPVVATETSGTLSIFGKKSEVICKNENEMVNRIILLLNNTQLYQKSQIEMMNIINKLPTVHDYTKAIDEGYKTLESL